MALPGVQPPRGASAHPIESAAAEPTPASSFRAIVDSLAVAVLIFRRYRLVYQNEAAQDLGARLRAKHRSELLVVIGDHLRGLDDKGGPTVSLLTGTHGEPFYVHVVPIGDLGEVAVTVRALGTSMRDVGARYHLSPREAQVVELVLLGYRNRDIAATLGTTPATVKKHLTHIFDKVGVDTRTQLVSRIA